MMTGDRDLLVGAVGPDRWHGGRAAAAGDDIVDTVDEGALVMSVAAVEHDIDAVLLEER